VVVDVYSVRALDTRRNSQLVRRQYTDADNDYVGGMFGAILGQHGTYTTRVRIAGERAYPRVTNDPHAVPGVFLFVKR
jgi:hypothetical protein